MKGHPQVMQQVMVEVGVNRGEEPGEGYSKQKGPAGEFGLTFLRRVCKTVATAEGEKWLTSEATSVGPNGYKPVNLRLYDPL